MAHPSRVIVIENRRCTALQRQSDGLYKGGHYEVMPSEGGQPLMISNGDTAWDAKMPATAAGSDVYFTLWPDEAVASAAARRGSEFDRAQFYKLTCEMGPSLRSRITVEMQRLYNEMDVQTIELPRTEACSQAYARQLDDAEALSKAATLGQLEFIQRFLRLSDADFTEAKIVEGFRRYLNPPKCAEPSPIVAATPSPASGVATIPSRPVTVEAAPERPSIESVRKVLSGIRMAMVVSDVAHRAQARAQGEAISPTVAKIQGIPRFLMIHSAYTAWVAFRVSSMNPSGDLAGVIRRLTEAVTQGTSQQKIDHSHLRVVLLTQRGEDTVRAAVDAAAGNLQQAGMAVSKFHQSKPVYRIEDVMANGRSRMTSDLEKMANVIVVAVLPTAAPASEPDILNYYSDFLNRQEDGLIMGTDIGGKVRTIQFD